MKRSKQVQTMVDSYNEYLKNNNIVNEYDKNFVVFTWTLSQAGVYQGFNYYTKEGFLSAGDPKKTAYIQLY